MSRQMFAEILSLNTRAAGTAFPSRSGARGSDRGDERRFIAGEPSGRPNGKSRSRDLCMI
jgi:hypothetical protein